MEISREIRRLSVCQVCHKQLSSKQNLKQHMNIHTGDKPYRCSYLGCENSYRHASQLSNHRMLHQQSNVHTKPEIDDFKAFISLVILALGPESKSYYHTPEGPYTKDDAHLPKLDNIQTNIKLPSLFEGMDLS